MGFKFFNFFKRKKKDEKKVKVGLALSGGGARGIGHIGVFKALKENNIEFDVVAGASIGAIMGAVYCAGIPVNQMIEVAQKSSIKDFYKSKFMILPSKTDKIQDFIIKHIGNIDVKDLKIPMGIVSVDMITGEEIVFTEGSLPKIVAGSCAVPGIFECVPYENMHLMDGGLCNNMPADVCKMMGCDYVVAVDIHSARGQGTPSTKIFDLLAASLRILTKSNVVKGKLHSDVIIEPKLDEYKSTQIGDVDEVVAEGYRATMAKMTQIKQLFDMNFNKMKKRKIKEMKKQFANDKVIDIEEEIELFDNE